MKKIELTPEWLLELSHTRYNSDDKTINFVCDNENLKWVKLGADALEVDYKYEEFYEEKEDGIYMSFDFGFKAEDIKKYCPKIYEGMRNMGVYRMSEMRKDNDIKPFTAETFDRLIGRNNN